MGITGLIPFLEKASSKINVKVLSGQTVAIDTYCWLHKGAFGCAEKLSLGEETTVHIKYCLKYVNLLLSHNVKPILVFDGRHLPAKAQTELKRRESRQQSKKRAQELLRMGKTQEARSYLQRCVDITHEMALQLIQECRKINVDCIVAPYEADAQMAYLNKINIADYVVTEDSDLVLFGCSKILFKLDLTGNCLLVEAEKLHLAMGCKLEKYTFDKFRYMCILSGCDYLDSLPGIGLAKSCKFILMTEETDMKRALTKIPSYLNMKNLEVTEEYIENFLKADATFKHMYVYDPLKRTVVRLHDLDEFGTDIEYCSNAGSPLDDETEFQLALGNINPFTLKKLDNWNPDMLNVQTRSNKILGSLTGTKHKSIWRRDFQFQTQKRKSESAACALQLKKIVFKAPMDTQESEIVESKSDIDLLSLYTRDQQASKRYCVSKPITTDECSEHENNDEDLSNNESNNENIPRIEEITPTKNTHNPFARGNTSDLTSHTELNKQNTSLLRNVSPIKKELSIEQKISLQKISKFERTVTNPNQKVLSRFFNTNLVKKTESKEISETQESIGDLQDLGKIISEVQSSQEQQTFDAAALYLASPQAKITDRGDRTPPRSMDSIDDSRPSRPITPEDNQNQNDLILSIDSGICIGTAPESIAEEKRDNASILERFAFNKTKFSCHISEISNENISRDAVVISDDEDKIAFISKKTLTKPKITTRRVGLNKPKEKSKIAQSKLSMFGFQKRPSLK